MCEMRATDIIHQKYTGKFAKISWTQHNIQKLNSQHQFE